MICVPFRECPNMKDDCVKLLNSEWPRSEYARHLYLEKSSNESFPKSLMLIDNSNDIQKLMGHSRLCTIPGRSKQCWLESVVICKDLRGKGLGKLLMQYTESYAKEFGFVSVYLSTHDQQQFYLKCGYHFCEPICTMGANAKLLEGPQFEHFRQRLVQSVQEQPIKIINLPSATSASVVQSAPPPPPPPPVTNNIKHNVTNAHQFMVKKLI